MESAEEASVDVASSRMVTDAASTSASVSTQPSVGATPSVFQPGILSTNIFEALLTEEDETMAEMAEKGSPLLSGSSAPVVQQDLLLEVQ